MKVLTLTDPLNNEVYINPDHVVLVHRPHGTLNPAHTAAIVILADGTHQAVRQSHGEVCFRLKELTGG